MFTDARVIAASRRFVCAADEVWRLQRGSESDCVFFQRMVNHGERITDRGTRQGVWVCAPGGVLLSHVNTRNVDQLLACLDEGYAAWERLSDDERHLDPNVTLEPKHRWEMNFPRDGLALERIGRDLGPDAAPLPSWNRDFAWFSHDELVRSLPAGAAVGDTIELPLMAMRLAQFHLVDNVRGQTLPYAPSEVQAAELRAKVVSRDGARVELALDGHTSADADGPWLLGESMWTPKETTPHGIECELTGRATWDEGEGRFETFELVAVGRRWGRAGVNGRGRDDSPGLVAFHLTRTDTNLAPTFVAVYGAEWIVKPEIATWRDAPEECGLSGG